VMQTLCLSVSELKNDEWILTIFSGSYCVHWYCFTCSCQIWHNNPKWGEETFRGWLPIPTQGLPYWTALSSEICNIMSILQLSDS